MFGAISKSKKPKKPQIYLCKPNLTTIAKLNEAHNVSHTTRLGDLNEISLSLPYQVDRKGRSVRNPNIDIVRERYLLRVEIGDKKEYYIINKIKDSSDSSSDSKTVNAISLGYQLRDKMVRGYEKIGISAREAVLDVVEYTTWQIGENLNSFFSYFNKSADSDGAGGRSFSVSSNTALDFLIQIAESFNAVIIWDTENRTIDFEQPDNVGENKGLSIAYGKYLQSIGKESNADEMITRLYPYGNEGLTIHGYNPTGSGYIEDFSFFMYPFMRDENKNVLKSSHYMSDELCNAILDYKELVESKQEDFTALLAKQTERIKELTLLQNHMFELRTDLYTIQDRITTQKAVDSFEDFDLTFELNSVDVLAKIDVYKVVFVKSVDENKAISINGENYSATTDKWLTVQVGQEFETVTFEAEVGDSFNIIIMQIAQEDSEKMTDEELVNEYNEYNKVDEMDAHQLVMDDKQAEIDLVVKDIEELREELAMEKNFTLEQIYERNEFIIEKEFTNDNILKDKELYEFAEDEFKKLREPQLVIDIDVVNFLEIVEAQRDWDRLVLGDIINIKHEILDINVQAKVIEIVYDHENGTIKLKIANVKDIKTDEDKLINALYGSISTSATVDMNKYKWGKIGMVTDAVDEWTNSPFDIAKQMIMSAQGDMTWDRNGLQIVSRVNPDEALIATAGVLAITKSGGRTWENAITTQGVIAERLIGKAIIGENLEIGDEEGTFTIKGNLLTIIDRDEITRLQLGEYEEDKFGMKLMNKNGTDIILDEDGILQTWQEGRTDNVDEDDGLALHIYLPTDTLSVRRAILNFKLLPFRSYSATTYASGKSVETSGGGGSVQTSTAGGGAVTKSTSSGGGVTESTTSGGNVSTSTASGGGSEKTSSSGGGTSKSTAGGGNHKHLIATQIGAPLSVSDNQSMFDFGAGSNPNVSDSIGVYFPGTYQSGVNLWTKGASDSHTHDFNVPSHTHSVSIPSHTHNFSVPSHSHSVSIPNHSHSMVIPNHTHDIDIPTHVHEIRIPEHTHDIIHGIYEGETAVGVGVRINGIDRTAVLGGKFNTDRENIVITDYLQIGQWNEVILTSDSLGRIDANVFIQTFMGT